MFLHRLHSRLLIQQFQIFNKLIDMPLDTRHGLQRKFIMNSLFRIPISIHMSLIKFLPYLRLILQYLIIQDHIPNFFRYLPRILINNIRDHSYPKSRTSGGKVTSIILQNAAGDDSSKSPYRAKN